jgi:competence protein ComEA
MPSPTPAFPIDLNTASQAELESLPWIGPVRAAEIIAYRQRTGSFTKIEDLLNVYGITPEVFQSIQNLITVNSPP